MHVTIMRVRARLPELTQLAASSRDIRPSSSFCVHSAGTENLPPAPSICPQTVPVVSLSPSWLTEATSACSKAYRPERTAKPYGKRFLRHPSAAQLTYGMHGLQGTLAHFPRVIHRAQNLLMPCIPAQHGGGFVAGDGQPDIADKQRNDRRKNAGGKISVGCPCVMAAPSAAIQNA